MGVLVHDDEVPRLRLHGVVGRLRRGNRRLELDRGRGGGGDGPLGKGGDKKYSAHLYFVFIQ